MDYNTYSDAKQYKSVKREEFLRIEWYSTVVFHL